MPEFLSPENARTTYRGHVQILKALKSRDAAQARSLIKRHIRIGRKRVLDFLDQSQGQATARPDQRGDLAGPDFPSLN